jgi:fructose-1,6-bisphosphatase/inositol monophosphatase family enzyme
MTDWQGRPLTLQSDGRVVAAASAEIHSALLEILAG